MELDPARALGKHLMELDPAWVNNHTCRNNNIIKEKTLKNIHYNGYKSISKIDELQSED